MWLTLQKVVSCTELLFENVLCLHLNLAENLPLQAGFHLKVFKFESRYLKLYALLLISRYKY